MAVEDRTSPLDRVAARSTIGGPPAGEPMLFDSLMPCYDAVRAEHRIVPGDIATVYAAARCADLHPRVAGVRRYPAAVRHPQPPKALAADEGLRLQSGPGGERTAPETLEGRDLVFKLTGEDTGGA